MAKAKPKTITVPTVTPEMQSAANKYAIGMAQFLGIPPSDLNKLKQRYINGLQRFAQAEEM